VAVELHIDVRRWRSQLHQLFSNFIALFHFLRLADVTSAKCRPLLTHDHTYFCGWHCVRSGPTQLINNSAATVCTFRDVFGEKKIIYSLFALKWNGMLKFNFFNRNGVPHIQRAYYSNRLLESVRICMLINNVYLWVL